jgi:hypothetical protein
VHSKEAGPLEQMRRFTACGLCVALGPGRLRAGTRFARRRGGGLRLRQFQAGHWGDARHRRRIAHRARQHIAEGIIDCRDVVARTRKPGATAFRGASTEHAE